MERLERAGDRVSQAMRAVLITLHVPLWVGCFASCWTSDHVHLVVPLGLMASVGTLMAQMRKRDGSDGLAAAELVLQAVLASRTLPTEEGLRLVTGEETGVAPPSHHRSAG